MVKQIRQLLNDMDFPVLPYKHLKLLDEVDLVLEDIGLKWAAASGPGPKPGSHSDEVFEKISVMEKNLKTIINKLKIGKSTEERFIAGFPLFKKVRKNVIVKLREIVAAMNADRDFCNKAKLAGLVTSWFGGALTLVSGAALIPTLGATSPLLMTGAALTGAGCATAIGTSFTESVLLKTKIEEAKKLIEEDRKCFQDLGDCLDHATELQTALTEVLNMCPSEKIIEAIKDFIERASKIQIESKRIRFIGDRLDKIIKYCLTILIGWPWEMVCKMVSVLVVTFQLLMNTQNGLVFDVALLTIRGGLFAIGLVIDDAMDVMGVLNLFTKASVRGAISAFGMMLDSAAIVFTSADIRNGSVCPDAQKIAEAADKLEEEAEKIEKIYRSLQDSIISRNKTNYIVNVEEVLSFLKQVFVVSFIIGFVYLLRILVQSGFL